MRRAALLSVLLLAVLAVPFGAAADSPPPGATAKCRDGSYSYSQHHSGTCSHHGGVAAWLDGSATTGGGKSAAPTTVAIGKTVLLARRTRSGGCVRSARPDRRCSPGAYYTGLTKAVLCSPGFHTGSVRRVTQSEKFAVEREYGMTPKLYGRTIEIDHIVSLELGGSNDVANLYPERGSGTANYHVKDKLENAVAALVCSGKLSLRAAQRAIASNWETLYLRVFRLAAARA